MAEQLQYLDSLNAKNTVFLIRQPSTGRILTGRRVSAEQKKLYDKLLHQQLPHIACVRDIIPEVDGHFLVLQDYIQGLTLEEILAKRNFLPYPQAAHICIQLCLALECLHALGIIHRDIKPSNVMLTPEQEAYLIDFDISRTHKEAQDADTEILGTKGYAAPEQFGFQQTDARTDIYAIGVLLNQLCTGQFPQCELVKSPLDRIVQRCIHLDPSKRYRSAAAVRTALEANYPECAAESELAQADSFKAPPRPGVPGFRSGNPVHILLATLGYSVFALLALALAIMAAAFHSFSNFVVGFILVAAPVVCYLFIFDIFSLRTRCKIVEKYRHTQNYTVYCLCLMIAWLVVCVLCMFVGVGIVAPFFEK